MLHLLFSAFSCLAPAAAAEGAPPQEAAAPVDDGFQCEALAEHRADEPEAALGLALERARRGRIEAAVSDLEGVLEAQGPRAEESQALARNWLERLRELAAARLELVEDAAKGGRLRIERDGEKFALNVASFEDGRLVLEPSRSHSITELALEELGAADLALNLGSRKSPGPDWAQGVCQWLSGDPDFAKGLPKGERELADELGESADLLRIGRGLQALEVAREAAGGNTERLEAALGALQVVRFDFDGFPALRPYLARYLEVGQELLAALGRTRELPDLLGTEPRYEDGGILVLDYDFTAGASFDDFSEIGEWWVSVGQYEEEEFPISDGPELYPDGLDVIGTYTFAHVLEFAPPARVELAINYLDVSEGRELGQVMVGLCARPAETWVIAWNFVTLQAIHLPRELSLVETAVDLRAFTDKAYTYLLDLRDGIATMATRGVERAKREVGEFEGGQVLFGVRTHDPLRIQRITIRGKPLETDLDALRARWARREFERTLRVD